MLISALVLLVLSVGFGTTVAMFIRPDWGLEAAAAFIVVVPLVRFMWPMIVNRVTWWRQTLQKYGINS